MAYTQPATQQQMRIHFYARLQSHLFVRQVHFHMIGACRTSYIQHTSIHHTYNRAIAIHGVHYLRVINNIAFETIGHTFFTEDGLESKNVISGDDQPPCAKRI